MVYQRKQRAYEQEPQRPVPPVQTSLFNSPDLETEEADNSFSVDSSKPAPTLEMRWQQASKPLYTLDNIGNGPVYPSGSAVQRHPMFPAEQAQPTGSMDGDLRRSAARHDFFGRMPQSGKPAVQRDVMADEAAVQKAPKGGAGGDEAVELTPQGSGRPLPKQVSDNFVQSGYPEVQQARVHVDDAATQSIQAHGYTMKNDIVVQSSGANDPKLLGHEATHVVQQSQMALKPDVNGTPINADRALEKNADDNGERVVRNEPVSVQGVGISGQTVESQTGAIQSKTMTESTMDGTPMQPQATIQRKGLYDLMMGRGSGKFVSSKYKSAQNNKPKKQTSKQADEEAKPNISQTVDKGQAVALIKATPDSGEEYLTFAEALKRLKKSGGFNAGWVELVLREMGGIAAPNNREKQIRAVMREKRKGDIPNEFEDWRSFKKTVKKEGKLVKIAHKSYLQTGGPSAGSDFRQRLLSGGLDLRDVQNTSPELKERINIESPSSTTEIGGMSTIIDRERDKQSNPTLAKAAWQDLLSIAIYTRGGFDGGNTPFVVMNGLLRNLDPQTAYDDKFKNDDKRLGIYEPYIMGISSGLNNLPPYKGRCFRGGDPPIDIRNKKYKPGKKVKEPGFSSASLNIRITESFPGSTFYVIDAAGGGSYISPVSEKGVGEVEVLFPHNSEFEVLGVYGFDSDFEARSCGHRFFQGTSASDLEKRKPDQFDKIYTGDEVSEAPVMLVHMKEIPTEKQAERANQYQEDNGASTDSYYDPILEKHRHLLGDSLQGDNRPPSTFGNEKSDEILALIEEYKAQLLAQGITFDDDDDDDVDSNYDEEDMLTRTRHNPATSRSGR